MLVFMQLNTTPILQGLAGLSLFMELKTLLQLDQPCFVELVCSCVIYWYYNLGVLVTAAVHIPFHYQ